MKIIGLTGGIGSGKSTVSQMIRRANLPVICADKLARDVVRPGTKAYKKIVKSFGREILKKNKTINRLELASIVFQSPSKRKILNKIVHPEVELQMKQETKKISRDRTVSCPRRGVKFNAPTLVVWDVPLLFEEGSDKKCDATVLVYAPKNTCIKRLMKRDGFTQKEIKQRIKSQMPMKKKRKKADYIIDNSGTLAQTRQQVNTMILKSPIFEP